MGIKSLERYPRASGAKALAAHRLTCVEIATGNPEYKTRFKIEARHAPQRRNKIARKLP